MLSRLLYTQKKITPKPMFSTPTITGNVFGMEHYGFFYSQTIGF